MPRKVCRIILGQLGAAGILVDVAGIEAAYRSILCSLRCLHCGRQVEEHLYNAPALAARIRELMDGCGVTSVIVAHPESLDIDMSRLRRLLGL